MSSQAWKGLERRVCRDMGLTRRGQVTAGGYAKGSDNADGPVSVEIKYTVRHQLPRRWIEQVRANSEEDGRPWVLVQGEHKGPGHPIDLLAVMEYATFLILYRAAFAPLGAATPGFGTPATTPSRSGL